MFSFITTAWITCVIAAVEWYCSACNKVRHDLNKSPPRDSRTLDILATQHVQDLPSWLEDYWPLVYFVRPVRKFCHGTVLLILYCFDTHHPKPGKFAKTSLDALSDVQLVTSIAIIIAAIIQIDSMTFYHQQFVLSYWFLTLNSFWAARAGDFNQDDEDESTWHYRTRTAAIFLTTVLSAYWQIIIIPRQHKYWDPAGPRHCFVSHDKSAYRQQFIWIAGLVTFAVYLLFLAAREFQKFESRWKQMKDAVVAILPAISTRMNRLQPPSQPWSGPSKYIWLLWKVAALHFIASISLLIWLSNEWLTMWAFGRSTSFLIIIAEFAFAGWNTGDLLDLKKSNRHLVSDETAWGFGQILPVVLLGLLLLNILDAANSQLLSLRVLLCTNEL